MSAPLHNSQIKSKKRVAEHGEVFTAEREVKAMCDLVAQECDRIDSRFLEPACGDGNFLAEILARKLTTVLIQVYGLLHNIFMLFVDITVLINEIAIISPIR